MTESSDAMDLENGVFTQRSAHAIAASVENSARQSSRRKSPVLRSAISMISFFINRAGRLLSKKRRKVLEQAKQDLKDKNARAKAKAKPNPE